MAINKYICCKLLNALTFNIALLAIGVLIYMNDLSELSQIIDQETQEWSQGIITNFLLPEGKNCPPDYE